MRSSKTLQVYCYVDSNFADLWSYEYPQDPTCFRSRTCFLIMIGDCPTVWSSKLQTETALSTMESEFIALNSALRELIPFQRLLKTVWTIVGMEDRDITTITLTVFEDNQSCLTLANLEPPRSKHYTLKYYWFRAQLKPNNIIIHTIDTSSKLADIFTKGLRVYFLKLADLNQWDSNHYLHPSWIHL